MAEMEDSKTIPPKEVKNGHRPADRHGLLQHSREFLDFFWDIAKPQQETRLEATEKLLEYLRTRPEGSEMKYALQRLITGLGIGRETARPCFSLALAQLLQSFEDIPLCSILEQIQEKHDLQKVKKAMMRPALFANLFGVLALFQSGRLVKDSEALTKSVQLLQTLAQHSNHLQEQPQKALVDILSEVPVAMLKEILPKVLTGGLNSVLSSPEYLALFILARQKVPVRLKKLMGSVDLFSDENIPRLVDVLKTAAASIKKERRLPNVTLDLLRLALQEDKFPRFWKEVIEQGLLKKRFWPANYMCFRLLGAALPLLSKEQLQLVMRGDLIRLFGEHVVTSQVPGQFRFAPEMTEYVSTFLEGCQDDPDRQLATVVAFTSISNLGLPVIKTNWHAVGSLSAPALRSYVAWLRDMFLQPNLDSLVNFNTSNQEKNQDPSLHGPERRVIRLRKWIIFRLVSIMENLHAKEEDALMEEVARFCLFHAFFETKKPMSQIPETKQQFSFPVDTHTREAVRSAFFSLLQALSTQFRPTRGQSQEKQPWPHRLAQFADMLLSHSSHVTALQPFTKPQRQAWNRMMQTLKELEARPSDAKADRAQARAFQHLLLLVGIHLFKSPEESCDLLGDIQTCIMKSMGEKAPRKRSKSATPQEPSWVEVLVEILLTLLAQTSHLVRLVTRSVFSHICSHLTPRALQLILDVLNPEKSQDDEEEETVVVTDDSQEELSKAAEDQDSDSEGAHSESEEESGEESDEEERDGDVDQGFREQLMAVLQAGKALYREDDDNDDEELDDEAMMALDQNLSSLFAEQKLRIQARRDEKNKLTKEKALRCNFQIRVLDLIEVLVTRQPENPLVLELLKPLLDIIRCSMRSSSSPQEKDLLHKTARIFSQNLFHARQYCRDLDNAEEMLHPRLVWLVQQAGRQVDASISLYYFNASLYLLRVLKGNALFKAQRETAGDCAKPEDPKAASGLDLGFVTPVYSSALTNFLTRRNSPLTAPMFLSLFVRHPVLCKDLFPVVIHHLTGQLRPRQQSQACLLLQKMLTMREVRLCFEDADWQQLIGQILAKVTENVRTLGQSEGKAAQQSELASLELLNTLFKNIQQGKLPTDLTSILGVLRSQQPTLQQQEVEAGSSRFHDLYWQAMKFLGVQRPKSEKKDAKDIPSETQNPVSTKRKKKGFLPETKKRKKRKAETVTPENAKPAPPSEDQPPSTGKKRKRRRKNKMNAQVPAQPAVNELSATGSPVPAPPAGNPSAPAKTPKQPKKKQKLSQVNGVSVPPTTEPANQQQQEKDPPPKVVSGKSPQSPQQRKKAKAKLSLANGSPSLPQKGGKKKKVQPRKGDGS